MAVKIASIPGFCGYMVSSSGTIWQKPGYINNSFDKPVLIKPAKKRNREGCKTVTVYAQEQPSDVLKRTTTTVARMVALAFCGPAPYERAKVRHIDGNVKNDRADNLEWKADVNPLAGGISPKPDAACKPIPGHPGYLAYSDGRIERDGVTVAQRFGKDKCVIVNVVVGDKRSCRAVAKLVALAFLGSPPMSSKKVVAKHRDKNTTNNRPENLYWHIPRESKVAI